jgi:thiosulfate/3-mercaptopyruvate sulfurtransferase
MKKIARYGVLAGGLAFAAVLVVALTGPRTASAIDWGKKELTNEQISVKVARETVNGGYALVLTDELKAWLDEKKPMLIVDTMPKKDSYDKEHIPGAVQFEFPIEEMKEMSAEQQAAYGKLLGADKARLIVVYCGFPKCGRSHNGAIWAKKLGYTNVARYVGGIKAWNEADYPVAKEE